MAPEVAILTLSAVFAVTSAISWRLNRTVQPMRIELVAKAEILMERPNLPATVRYLVEDNVRTVFGVRVRLLFGIAAVPIVALLYLFRQRWLPDTRQEIAGLSPEDRELFREVCDLHDRITFVNHILLYPMLEGELLLFVMPAVILRGLLRGVLDQPGTADVVRNVIEHRRYRDLRFTIGTAC